MAKILVVDDEPDMIWALTNLLLSENHSVISVNSGEEALEKIPNTTVDLVLLDFRLPGMDGLQVLQKIKEIKPDLPVIMVTGYGGIEEAVQSMKLGASHYLPKPFDNDQLIEIVNKSLQLAALKKGGIFERRAAEKIQTPLELGEKTQRTSREALRLTRTKKMRNFIFYGAISLLLVSLPLFFWFSAREVDREYGIPFLRISGLSWGGESLWVSDWFAQTIHQYELKGNKLNLVKPFPFSGYHFTGIAWAGDFIFSCDSWKKVIIKHNLDSTLSIAETYPSPGANPSGLFYDGKYLWSCDGNSRKIYQHLLDKELTIVATYDSPAIFPVGLYHDKLIFWTASAVGMKIFRNLISERFRLDKAFILPDSVEIGQQISAFTIKDDKIWIAYEGVNKIYQRNLKNLKEVTP